MNSIAGGILLYNALVDLLVPAFYGAQLVDVARGTLMHGS